MKDYDSIWENMENKYLCYIWYEVYTETWSKNSISLQWSCPHSKHHLMRLEWHFHFCRHHITSFEFTLKSTCSFWCFFFSWRLRFRIAPNICQHSVHFSLAWQVLCLSSLGWFGKLLGFSEHFPAMHWSEWGVRSFRVHLFDFSPLCVFKCLLK